jgi:EAL domain-containing protein (putative c-di-GMP-specific phosphodiesterase class I)
LQNAEKSGLNEWHIYDATETAGGRDVFHEDMWRETLRKVIDERAVVLLFQAVKTPDLENEMHREVLARIRPAPDGELVSAGMFFPMAARVDMTTELDKLIVEAAIEHTDENENVRLAINLSRQSVADPAFGEWLSAQLSAHRNFASRLSLEVTEQVAVGAPDAVLLLAATVRRFGVAFGVDHCGARDVALEYMKQLKADYSKIDGSFIKNLDRDIEKQNYVKSLVEFGHALEFKVIAEFVETEAELEKAESLGFDGVQGHYIGMPEGR